MLLLPLLLSLFILFFFLLSFCPCWNAIQSRMFWIIRCWKACDFPWFFHYLPSFSVAPFSTSFQPTKTTRFTIFSTNKWMWLKFNVWVDFSYYAYGYSTSIWCCIFVLLVIKFVRTCRYLTLGCFSFSFFHCSNEWWNEKHFFSSNKTIVIKSLVPKQKVINFKANSFIWKDPRDQLPTKVYVLFNWLTQNPYATTPSNVTVLPTFPYIFFFIHHEIARVRFYPAVMRKMIAVWILLSLFYYLEAFLPSS